MNNYKYKVSGEEIILSASEHEQVLNAMTNKQSHAILRNGKLVIKLDLIGIIKETEQPTTVEEEKKYEMLSLPPEQRPIQTSGLLPRPVSGNRGGGLQKAIANDWKNCADCGEPHFIPGEKTLCLPCLRKSQKKGSLI